MDELYKFRKEAEFRRFSPRTIETYEGCLRKFFEAVRKDYREITKKDVREFLEELQARKVAGGTMHVYLNAIKFFFEGIMHRNFRIDIKYSRRPKKIPVFLNKEEVKRMLEEVHNLKHRLIIEVLYGGGLRVSELINLKVKDIEINKGYGFVREGKGGKDRIFVLSKVVQDKLKNLIEIEKLEKQNFVFITNRKWKYSDESVREIIKKAAKFAGINKKIGCHTLRHSFATHQIENGYSLNEVQAMLGHKSPETSMIYVHMASPNMLNIKSPLDSL